MEKKEIHLALVNDIPTLIKMQECTLEYLKETENNPDIIDFQEDILKCLKVMNKIDAVYLDRN